MKRLWEKYRDQGLVVLWIGHQDKIRKLNRYIKKVGLDDYLFDRDDSVAMKYGITYGAGIVFIDRQGVVRTRIPKGFSPQDLEKGIKKIL